MSPASATRIGHAAGGGFKYPCEDGEVLLFVGRPRPRVALTYFGRVSEESGRCHELSERRFIAFAPVWQT
jgi:hypothetical protein